MARSASLAPGVDAAHIARADAASTPGLIRSIFQTPRPCCQCGRDFLPPKRPDRRIAEYCSYACEKAIGLRAAERFYRKADTTAESEAERVAPQPRIRVVPLERRSDVLRPARSVRSHFGENLAALRSAKHLRQRELAALVGVAQNTIALWENDRCDPPSGKLRRLADIFDVSMDDLWRGSVVTRDGQGRGEAVS
jgi:DNA-binding XRE family transcriptional regulator